MTVALPKFRVGDPVRYKSLSVFPLFSETNGGVDYRLADEAIADESLLVEEVSEGGSVPDLLVENKGETRVLFIEGEELVGAKQNRILNTSVLIAAKSKVKIPVSCVEQGRWGYKSRYFGSSGSSSPSKLRYALKKAVGGSARAGEGHKSDQGEVWDSVAAFDEWLLKFHCQPIRKPLRESYLPAEQFLTWHKRQVFKRPPRELLRRI